MGNQTSTLYERDFLEWSAATAKALEERRFCDVDVAQVAEEIRSMGIEQEHRLESYFRRLILHLLKWQFQPVRRSPSWRRSIVNSRIQIGRVLERSPSLQHKRDELAAMAYADAVKLASVETGLPPLLFPSQCPYSVESLMDDRFLPE